MKNPTLAISTVFLGAIIFVGSVQAAPKPGPVFDWATVVNNNDLMPPLNLSNFNSYNQPSVNLKGLVVIRARSRGGPPLGQPVHGIYTRDMSVKNSHLIRILDRTSEVPAPNNLGTLFVETPSFPRIDMDSDTIATRGNHQPVWNYVTGTDPVTGEDIETRAGTTGIYTNPFGTLITGASKLGDVADFSYLEVPEFPGIRFEVFPGAPAVTQSDTIVFKGNYTVDLLGKTGVYYRDLEDEPTGGTSPVVLIANNTDTVIPGTGTVFGSTSPPSAANGRVVFAGFDDEDAPTLGGIYLAPLQSQPPLTPLVRIGERVPGETSRDTFNGLGEGGAFDGRNIGFWGAWGNETRTVRLYCPAEGNKDRIDYCNQALVCEDTGETLGDDNSICDDESDPNFGISCYQDKDVPVHQGIFVHDTETRSTRIVAETGAQFDEFLFWNYSGKTPCVGAGHSVEDAEDEGEPARWRSSAFVAVSNGPGATYQAAFKARKGELVDGVYVDPVDGIYLRSGPGQGQAVVTVLDTTMEGQALDPEAPAGSTVTELGLERESLRGKWLAVNASMGIEGGTEEEGMAGIYLTELP
jgi:hypothetical protein